MKADQESVNTSNDDVSQTIGKTQMQNLPVADRSPLGFLQTQAGINNAAGSTAVNGQRSSYVNVTVDGINVQDNFIRTNDVDFLPNLLREAFFRCRCDQLPVLKQGRGTIVIIAGDSENVHRSELFPRFRQVTGALFPYVPRARRSCRRA